MKKALIIGGGLLAGGLLVAAASRAHAAPGLSQPEDYPPHRSGEFGPVWKDQRPPGLPDSIRGCSAGGAAVPFIRDFGGRQQLGPDFVAMVLELADGESGQMFGRPANNYDNRRRLPEGLAPGITQEGLSALGHEPSGALARITRIALTAAGWSPERIDALARRVATYRPWGKGRISAWGCFQWNEGHGQESDSLADLGIPGPPGFGPSWLPINDSPSKELSGPITYYGQIWAYVRRHRGTAVDAGRAVRAHHHKSSPGRRLLIRGRDSGRWDEAFAAEFSPRDRGRIDRHLRTAGVLSA